MDEDLKALHETLKAAAESKATAHIGHKECQRAADAIQRTVDEAFDKDAQSNSKD